MFSIEEQIVLERLVPKSDSASDRSAGSRQLHATQREITNPKMVSSPSMRMVPILNFILAMAMVQARDTDRAAHSFDRTSIVLSLH